MPAHIACRPWSYDDEAAAGCFVVCAAHDLRASFGFAHAVARAACLEHNAIHHADERRRQAPLLSLVYESSATTAFESSSLSTLLTDARRNNAAFGITGMLLFEDGWFLQALEGPAPLVERLMQTIRDDPRHDHVRILARESLRKRRFPDWAMAEGGIGRIESLPLAQTFEALLLTRSRTAAAA